LEDILRKASQAAFYLKENGYTGNIAIILGSGLSDNIENIVKNKKEIKYEDIPNFPISTVLGHAGTLMFGQAYEKNVLAMKGRFHYYEGHDISSITFAIRVLSLLGVKYLMVTNAAGGINLSFCPGDLVIIKDHIGLFAPPVLRGKNIDELGPRFLDMSVAYDRELIKIAKDAAIDRDITVKEGVYTYMQGPTYETPAEVKALSILGGDVVGMSTVPEVVVARHCGIRVLGISCVTNMAAGIARQYVDHSEVLATSKRVAKEFAYLIDGILKKIDESN